MKKYRFTEEEIFEIREARRRNRDKNVDRRLKALELRAEGRTGKEIAEITEYSPWYISKLAAKYRKGGTRGDRRLKKINARIRELTEVFHNSTRVRLMFQDETCFGRINKPNTNH